MLTRWVQKISLAIPVALVACSGISPSPHTPDSRSENEKKPSLDDEPYEPEPDDSAPEANVYFRFFYWGRDGWITSYPGTAEELDRQWHYRATIKAERIRSVELVGPAGNVVRQYRFRYKKSSYSWKRLNGWGTLTEETTVYADARIVRKLRSGAYSYGGCHHVVATFSERGDLVSEKCVDRQGNPMPSDLGCFERRMTHNANHFVLTTACYSFDGSAMNDVGGAHRQERIPNRDGYTVEVRHFDTSGNPAKGTPGCERMTVRYSDYGDEVEKTCRDSRGKEVPFASHSWSVVRKEWDARGCLRVEGYADPKGRLVGDFGVIARFFRSNEFCEFTLEEQLGENGALSAGRPRSIARLFRRYNERGDAVEVQCFGFSGTPTGCNSNPNGWGSVVTREFDDKGRVTAERHFDDKGNPTASSLEYPHLFRYRFDDEGRALETTYYDEADRPAVALGTVWKYTNEYDALGSVVSTKSFGLSGQPVLSSLGVFEIRIGYNSLRQRKSISLLGTQQEPVEPTAWEIYGVLWPKGTSRVEVQRGAAPKNAFFDKAGQPVSVVDCSSADTLCYR